MTTVPDAILAKRIRHAVDLTYYANATVRDIIGLINDAERNLLERLARRLEKDATWTNARMKALFADLASTNAANHKVAADRLAAEMNEFAAHEAEQTAAIIEAAKPPTYGLPPAVAKQINVAFDITLPTAAQLAAIVSKEPIRVGAEGKLLLEEIFEKLAAGKIDKIRQAVRLGMVEGEGVDQIVRRLKGTRAARYTDGILEGSRRDMANMVRTIVMDVSNKAAAATYAKNTDIIKGMRWTSTLDGRTSIICQSRDGQIFPVGSTTTPPAHVNCRSFMVPILKSWAEMGVHIEEMPPSTRASMNGQVPDSLTYPEWLKKHPEMAKNALGATRAKLFVDGKMPIDRFIDDKGKTISLAELKEKQAKYFVKAGL